ncbi:MAG: bifunctional glutamate N-acetyltransferase/amino-acid acetyltransferase ArgJ [Rickettsiales bacterium]|nr:bifunctional glutamate N-acetyltransferase/amino-acid acetyltransferase ArgJ [Pseudomonadota bacterium]MDA0965802.1 bifunctional glutamate N-acetyltransferase/amino-acid acetyltransferase ArgJ [Pseudomonadota bacterium]MDG4543736.1 bifunctional glutamate N-acetyltransferase/amino-acid acetyltransferase ArgJ [Rickettsiales bacterium]MDG4545883.1 bifunctional glutamate N-acetyltransferase/amino-acid acetyltransferase ArgJ [Rickettsiales bacterium]MDG4548129.1 bifunctional glutamate N-acetyltra
MKISPLAPTSFPVMPQIEGVKIATAAVGIKYKNRTDLMLAEFAAGTVVAGCFTKSKTCSANILWGREALKQGAARVLIVNSGNSNAFNGRSGEESVERIVNYTAQIFDCDNEEVYPCATGVIGAPLPDDKITSALSSLKNNLKPDIYEEAAKAIMTTDTYPKGSTRTAVIGGVEVRINGIAKGSGMIAPDMATMLSYIFTDANIEQEKLQKIFLKSIENSFNSITVDSDTSTSDTALIFATGKAGNDKKADLRDFEDKLQELLLDLAHQVVKDGEGAAKFVQITVTGAENKKAAKVIAMSIANSPLVKTAIAGEDANWGRIVMAVGKSGEEADRDAMSVSVGGVNIVTDGQLNPSYNEGDVTAHMKGQNIEILTDVGIDDGEATVWTCDLTHDYITINADYRS